MANVKIAVWLLGAALLTGIGVTSALAKCGGGDSASSAASKCGSKSSSSAAGKCGAGKCGG